MKAQSNGHDNFIQRQCFYRTVDHLNAQDLFGQTRATGAVGTHHGEQTSCLQKSFWFT